MALCDTCEWYNKQFDDFRNTYDDTIDDNDKRENHGCIMYEDFMPKKIWHENGDCPYYQKIGSK